MGIIPPITSTKNTITLNWYLYDEKNNCSIDMVLTRCNHVYTEGYGYEVKETSWSNHTDLGQNPRIVRLVVEDLSPFTKYLCSGWIINSAGWSYPWFPVSFNTKEDGYYVFQSEMYTICQRDINN